MNEFNTENEPTITKLAANIFHLSMNEVLINATLYKGEPLYNTLNVVITGKSSEHLVINFTLLKIFTKNLKEAGFNFSESNEFERWEILFNAAKNQIILKNFLLK